MEVSIIEQIADKIAAWPLERQREALVAIEALEQRISSGPGTEPSRHLQLKGITAGTGPALTLADLAEARKEMWGELMEAEP
ncbi:MAG: hypothetical protein ACKV2V_30960 [Blastocatellia bacterium]